MKNQNNRNISDISVDVDSLNYLEMKDVVMNVISHPKSSPLVSLHKLKSMQHKPFLNMLAKHSYAFEKYKTNTSTLNAKGNVKKPRRFDIASNVPDSIYKPILKQIDYVNRTRDLANEPGNIIYPETFCETVKKMFSAIDNVKITIFDEKDLLKMGMNLIYAVGKGSVHPPRMMIIEYITNKSNDNIVLVGKGVTFDSGGYNLKPDDSMLGMHVDKTGGSIVALTLRYLAKTQNKNKNKNFIGVIPLADNLVSGKAYKPGDIFIAYNRKSVEVTDSDAEGRLLLADALAFSCEKYKPEYIIDVATLTGWSSRLHCDIAFSYFTLNETIAKIMSEFTEKNINGERSVRLPPWLEYRRFTKSKVADYKNSNYEGCSKNEGFMASLFLSNFIPDKYVKKWIHIDIANHDTNGFSNCNSMHSILDLVERLR